MWNKRHRKGSPCGLLPHQNKDLRLLTPFYQLNCHKFKRLAILESCTEEEIDTEADQCFVTLEVVFEVRKHKITNTSLWPVQMWSSEVLANLIQIHSKSALSGKRYMKKKVETNHKMKFLLFWAIVLLYGSAKYVALIPHRKLSTVSALSALILWWTSVHGEWGFVEYIHWVQNNHIRSSRITLVLGGRGDRSGS